MKITFSSLVVAAVLVASTASAQSRFYGVLINASVPAGNADLGGFATLQTATLTASSCSQFVNHELWYGVVPNATRWVEVGFKDGLSQAGCKTRTVFWGENNGSGYHFHAAANSWALATWYSVYIQATTNCQWYAYAGGIQLGKSLANCGGTGRYLAAGIEATSQAAGQLVKGFSFDWKRENSSSTWVSGWSSPGLYQDSPPLIQYTDATQTVTEEVLNVPF